jgi:nucleoid-associated protein YgaU
VPLEKAFLRKIIPEVAAPIPVMFNPEEYTLSKDINYAQAGVPGLNAPLIQFVHGNAQTLEMELFLDTYETKADVRDSTKRLTDLMTTDAQTHAPPVLLFVWGSLTFTCVLAKVSQRFILFLPSGVPVRARLQVTFQEFFDQELQAKTSKHETADYSKLHVVGDGETLSGIAALVYENPTLWRPIALFNGIDDPRSLWTGQRLLIPQLPFRDPETGEVMQ